MHADDASPFADLIRRHRQAAGLTQQELAARGGFLGALPAGPLVGREPELRQLLGALAVPWRGRGCVSAGDHRCHSTEGNERLPPSPAPSGSTAGLKKRSFLYGPAHRAQMLAKAQGGRLPALRKVVDEPYLAAQ